MQARDIQNVTMLGAEGEEFSAYATSMGEPYREGVTLTYRTQDWGKLSTVFLELHEAQRLRNFLNEVLK